MILEEETFKEYKYHPKDLSYGSAKKVLAACDRCGKIRITNKNLYRSLCKTCAMKNMSGERKQKLRELRIGTCHSEKTKQKMREAHKGNKNHFYGKHHTTESKKKMSDELKGQKKPPSSEEAKQNMSRAKKGENNPNWQGGISFEPYCILFNDEFKERVREYWDRKCGKCGKSEKENGKKLSVHHILYNKDTCCDDSEPLFVPLCKSCHSKTNSNRKYWERYFTDLIMKKYNGKCYIPKE